MRGLGFAAVAAFVVDQASKWAVVHGLQVAARGEIPVFPPLLTFRYGENTGINFGLLDGGSAETRWILIAFSLAVMAGVFWWARRHADRAWVQISAGLLIGGALGNVVDRLLYGHVLDFLNMSCCWINNPYVFNLADVFIFAGAIGLIWFDPGQREEKAP